MKIIRLFFLLFLASAISVAAYGGDENSFVEVNIKSFDNSSVLYILRGLEKAEKSGAQGLIINMDGIPAPGADHETAVSESGIVLLSKLVTKLQNSKIPVVMSAENSNLGTMLFILYVCGDITISDMGSKFGGTKNLHLDNGELLEKYNSLIYDVTAATGHNYAIASALAHNMRLADASAVAAYRIIDILTISPGTGDSDENILSALTQYNGKRLHLVNKGTLSVDSGTKITRLDKDWLDNIQSVFDEDNPAMVWVDLLLWIIILGAIIIYAPFLLPVLSYIIPLVAVIISGIIFLGTPQAHDAVYSVLGVIIGIALVAIDLILFGSIVLSIAGVAIAVYSVLLLFGVHLYDNNFMGGLFIMNSILITWITIVVIAIAVAALMIYLAVRSQAKPRYNGNITMIGRIGKVIDFSDDDGRYRVQIEDEIWSAVSDDILFANEKVEVTGVDELILKVKKHELV